MTLFYMDASRLEKMRSSVRVMFFDFSSAFNIIKLMRDKQDQTGLDHCLTMWLLDYLTNLPEFVRRGEQTFIFRGQNPRLAFTTFQQRKFWKEDLKKGRFAGPTMQWAVRPGETLQTNRSHQKTGHCPAEVFDRRVITALTSTVICRKRETECERNLLSYPFILQLLFR